MKDLPAHLWSTIQTRGRCVRCGKAWKLPLRTRRKKARCENCSAKQFDEPSGRQLDVWHFRMLIENCGLTTLQPGESRELKLWLRRSQYDSLRQALFWYSGERRRQIKSEWILRDEVGIYRVTMGAEEIPLSPLLEPVTEDTVGNRCVMCGVQWRRKIALRTACSSCGTTAFEWPSGRKLSLEKCIKLIRNCGVKRLKPGCYIDLRLWEYKRQYDALLDALKWHANRIRRYIHFDFVDWPSGGVALRLSMERDPEPEPVKPAPEAEEVIATENCASSGALGAGFDALDGDGGRAV